MQTIDCGYLRDEHELAPTGAPYVVVGVASWEAADAVHAALAPITYLDEAAWVVDWQPSPNAFRTIRVIIDVGALEGAGET